MGLHERSCAAKSFRFPNKNFFYTKLYHSAGTKIAWHKGLLQDSITVSAYPAGIPETIDFGVGDRIILLHPFIPASAGNLSILNKDRANWNTMLGTSCLCLRN